MKKNTETKTVFTAKMLVTSLKYIGSTEGKVIDRVYSVLEGLSKSTIEELTSYKDVIKSAQQTYKKCSYFEKLVTINNKLIKGDVLPDGWESMGIDTIKKEMYIATEDTKEDKGVATEDTKEEEATPPTEEALTDTLKALVTLKSCSDKELTSKLSHLSNLQLMSLQISLKNLEVF